MIPKANRFHGLNALSHVYRKGVGAREGSLSIKTAPSRHKDYRLAVVVSKKVHKSAVTRNRIRRRLYELVRSVKQNDPNPWPRDIVLTCFDEKVATMPADELRENVQKLLKKAKITTQ